MSCELLKINEKGEFKWDGIYKIERLNRNLCE